MRIVLVAVLALAFLTACSTRRDDGMGDLWRGVKQLQGRE